MTKNTNMNQEQSAIIVHPGEVLREDFLLYFDMSTEFWLGIQHDYEQDFLEELRTNLSKEITPLRVVNN